MPLIINTNTLSLNAQTHLTNNTNSLQKSMEKLASGFRINRAGDDAAGLQLSENLRSQFRGAQKAADNVQDAINMLNIADGAMQVIEDNLQRIRELSVQAANDTYSQNQRDAINQEINARLNDIDRIAQATVYNNNNLLDGTFGGGANVWIQVGPNADDGIPATPELNRIDVAGAVDDARIANLTAGAVAPAAVITSVQSGGGGVNITDSNSAQAVIASMDEAIDTLNVQRGNLGSFVNQLESAWANLAQSVENMQAAESRIRNVDVAQESATLVKYQILQQSAATILAQANQTPALALQLLQG